MRAAVVETDASDVRGSYGVGAGAAQSGRPGDAAEMLGTEVMAAYPVEP